jgi:hypothetical protein
MSLGLRVSDLELIGSMNWQGGLADGGINVKWKHDFFRGVKPAHLTGLHVSIHLFHHVSRYLVS